jgi:hypothetical protein
VAAHSGGQPESEEEDSWTRPSGGNGCHQRVRHRLGRRAELRATFDEALAEGAVSDPHR